MVKTEIAKVKYGNVHHQSLQTLECKVKFPSLNNSTTRKLESKMFGLQSIRDSLSMLLE